LHLCPSATRVTVVRHRPVNYHPTGIGDELPSTGLGERSVTLEVVRDVVMSGRPAGLHPERARGDNSELTREINESCSTWDAVYP
jgi:hypothetical protein